LAFGRSPLKSQPTPNPSLDKEGKKQDEKSLLLKRDLGRLRLRRGNQNEKIMRE